MKTQAQGFPESASWLHFEQGKQSLPSAPMDLQIIAVLNDNTILEIRSLPSFIKMTTMVDDDYHICFILF